MDPMVYLAIDNCFAAKRWVAPAEWARIVRELGLSCVEASADTECDPLYQGRDYQAGWIREVRRQDVTVKNVYSGHGTYVTCGLSHPDPAVARRFLDEWIRPQMDTARALDAGFGFFAHGFEEAVLQNRDAYLERLDRLYDALAEVAAYGREIGLSAAGLEQMYSPHQPPWTIDGAKTLLKEVCRRSGAPFYITADVGHMNGQQYFPYPTEDYIRTQMACLREGCPNRRVWMGSDRAFDLYEKAGRGEITEDAAAAGILEEVGRMPHLFARERDWNAGEWLRELGCYSPIVHLQQTDGKSSPHWPFSAACNEKGIIRGEDLLRDLAESFQGPDEPGMPPKTAEVTLTLEPFISTAGSVRDLLDDLRESVAYWRRFVPRDGMRLSEIKYESIPSKRRNEI